MSSSSTPQHPPPPPPPPPPIQDGVAPNFPVPPGTPAMNGGNDVSLTAAADLIRSLDSAFAEMTSLSSSAAKDAEDARRNARAASEVARRYTSRTFPKALPPPMSESMPRNNSQSSLSFERKRKTQQPLPSVNPGTVAERFAQLHTEDVLRVSLELERTKEQLEQERREHDQTRMSCTLNRAKNCELESQMEKLLADMEKQREDHGRMVDRFKEELLRSKKRLEAAEEDAQVALDLAKDSASSRQELESLLEKALEENTLLRDQMEQVGVPPGSVMPTSPFPRSRGNSVRFAESPTVVTVQGEDGSVVAASHPPSMPTNVALSTSIPSRAMVDAGRSLLSRTPEKAHIVRLTPQKSLERRQRLRDRLKALGEDSASLVPSPAKSLAISSVNRTTENYRAVSNILRDSAVRLHLTGRWDIATVENSSHLDSLARRFCTSVETKINIQAVQISEQHVQINDLSSLCGYLEDRLSVSNDKETHSET